MAEESKVRSSTLLFRRICAIILLRPHKRNQPPAKDGWGRFIKGAVRKRKPCRCLPLPASGQASAYRARQISFSLCVLPCNHPRAVSRLLFFYQIRLYLSSLSINHKLLIIILLPIILNLLKFFQLFLC